MATLKCQACGGVFDDVQADGVRYFHRCAPLTRQRVQLADTSIALVDARMTVAVVKEIDGTVTVTRTFDPPLPLGSIWLEETSIERANARDENIDLVKVKAATNDDGTRKEGTRAADLIKSAGAGVVVVKG